MINIVASWRSNAGLFWENERTVEQEIDNLANHKDPSRVERHEQKQQLNIQEKEYCQTNNYLNPKKIIGAKKLEQYIYKKQCLWDINNEFLSNAFNTKQELQ